MKGVRTAVLLTGAAMLTAMATWPTHAAQLLVRPVNIQLKAPAATSKLVLTNRGRTPITAQVRLFRWTQKNGRDVLERTRMVVASPPLLKMRPGREYIVRIVRLAKIPVRGEEAYRLLVDEIPQKKLKGSGVVFALRYSIPVFFQQPGATPPKVSWQAFSRKGRLILRATNAGQLHERIVGLKLTLPGGRTKTLYPGLAGYVLGNSVRQWVARVSIRKGATLTIRGQGINGPFTAKVRVR